MAKEIDLTPKYFPIIPAKEKIELPTSFDDIELSGIKTGNLIKEVSNASKLKTAAKMADCIVAKSGGDYTSIQAALDAGGKNIFVKKGTYEISSAITILSSGVTIKGESKTNTIIKLANGANVSAIVVGNGATTLSDIVIEDIQVDGNKANQTTTSHGIYFYGASENYISESMVKDCWIHDCYNAGISLNWGNGNTINGNRITSNDEYGIYGYGYISDNLIMGNAVKSNYYGIYLDNTNDTIVLGNHVKSNTYFGINLHVARYCLIMGNMANSNREGIYIHSSDDNIIIENHANSNTYRGIYLYYSDKNSIIGNRVQGNGTWGIQIADVDSDSNLVVKNYCTGNTSGGIDNAGTGTILAASTTNDNIV